MATKTVDPEAETLAQRRTREEDAAAPQDAVADQDEVQEADDMREEPSSEEPESEQFVVEERPGGQLAIGGPGTEPLFSTDAGGPPPEEAEFVLKSTRREWGYDMKRGDDLCLLVHARVGPVVIGAKKVFPADVLDFVEFETPLGAREALMAVHDLRSRAQYDRAVIDQAAQLAQKILEEGQTEAGVDLAAEMREVLYKRFHIDDDAREVTYGVDEIGIGLPEPAQGDEGDAEAVEPEPLGELVPEADILAAREADLERRIQQAIFEGDTEREGVLRDELEQVRVEADPDLAWEE